MARRPDDPKLVYDVHVFCCVNKRPTGHRRGCCADKNARRLCNYMCRRAMALGLRHVRINHAGCLNLCEFGPIMVIYPEGIWYAYASEADIEEILRWPVVGGGRVERLLLKARDRRPRPERDDKVLADWNGLMVTALVEAGLAFEAPAWIAAARDAFAYVCEYLCAEGRLHHSHCRGRRGPAGFLDDHANMSRAALALHEATGEESYLMLARSWVAVLDARYRDAAGGGYFMSAGDDDTAVVRLKSVEETAAPAGNGVMVGVLARLHALTGEAGYRARAEEILAAFADRLTRRGITAATALNNSEALRRLMQVVVAGPPEAPETAALRRVVHRTYVPDRLAIVSPPGATLPEGHPAAGKLPADGGAAAFVCVGTTCFPPVREPSALREALRRHAAPSLCADA